MKFVARLEKDGDSLVLPLPEEVVVSMGIEEGDELILESFEASVATLRLVKTKSSVSVSPSLKP